MVIFHSYVKLPEGNYMFFYLQIPWCLAAFQILYLVGGAITILKNMKVNGKDDIPYIPYMKWKIKVMFQSPPTKNVPNHQPVYEVFIITTGSCGGLKV